MDLASANHTGAQPTIKHVGVGVDDRGSGQGNGTGLRQCEVPAKPFQLSFPQRGGGQEGQRR